MQPTGVIFEGVTPDSPLRRWRRKHGFTQTSLAARCGVSANAVARWEKAKQEGGRKPAGEALICLMALTRLPAEALIFPERYLRDHPAYLEAWASAPQRRGRPKRSRERDA
jgi:transcriptional regulator with XRE-family HTH domain